MEDTNALEELKHYGVLRRSGRYPWGSGKDPYQNNKNFLAYIKEMEDSGLSLTQIAAGLGIVDNKGKVTSTPLRRARSLAVMEVRAAEATEAQRLRDKGLSTTAIAERMYGTKSKESTVRSLLDPGARERNAVIHTISETLKKHVDEKTYIDVGAGTAQTLGVSPDKLKTAISGLVEKGYGIHYTNVEQVGNPGKFTSVMVLVPPGITAKDVYHNKPLIRTVSEYSEDGGRTFLGIEPPVAINPNRVQVRYKEQGGATMDGVIELRRGVDDISLGQSRYAQVRVQVGPDKFLKGMAMYADDLPDGVDIRFNTNKSDTGNKLDAMKGIKDDPDNPFGSTIRQKHYIDPKSGKRKLSALNIVGSENPLNPEESTSGEEGGWSKWSSKLSSQMLSKQSTPLAKQQLDLTYDINKAELDEIMALTNPTVKKHLLLKYADNMDSKAVHLQAAGLPRTASKVILPINSLKDNEIYAPTFRDGERVVLIRHPHGGIFEIPELTVNNRNRQANRLIKNAIDAVGINSKVAERLSGADFDGDTVLVIPQGEKRPIRTKKPLEQLKKFDPQNMYRPYDGMRTIDGGFWNAAARKVEYPDGKNPGTKQTQMGIISNLITDMTIGGANDAEIARAVKHSMVVIDAEKHSLNYKQSYKDNGIKQLQELYQPDGGASTLISRASSQKRVPMRNLRRASEGGPIDPATGKLVFTPTGEVKMKRTVDAATGKVTYVPTTELKTFKSTKLAETDDANTLLSNRGVGTPIEKVYANHSNRLKALANEARKTAVSTKGIVRDDNAAKVYSQEVGSLNAKLTTALQNSPRERQAQLLARSVVDAKFKANPKMEAAEKKKVQTQALREARLRNGAKKERIQITDNEWRAIQAGAISNSKLIQILENTDLDLVKNLATPRTDNPVMTAALSARAENMLAAGYTQAEVASHLGIPTSTLSSFVQRG